MFCNISWTTWPKQFIDPILESKFEHADVEIMKIENSREIRGLGPSFPKRPQCSKYPKICETLPLTEFYTWVMLQLMWNVGFKAFYEFLYIQSPWFGVFGPNFPDLCQCPKYTKTGINQPSDSLYIWVRFHLMWNVEFNFLDNFLCIGVHDLGCLGSVGPTCPNSSNILKQV